MSFSEASPPFDGASNVATVDNMRPVADLIIRSSDRVEFRVHKAILSLASQTFAAMFHGTGATIIDSQEPLALEEDERTLDALFRACYPILDPELESAEDIFKLMKASRKYMMEHAEQIAYRALMSPDLLKSDPFSAFSIACHFGLAEEARRAATRTLQCSPPRNVPVALQSVGGVNLWNLLAYARDCKEAILNTLDDDAFWYGRLEAEHYTMFFCGDCHPEVRVLGFDEDMLRACGLAPTDFERQTMQLLRALPSAVPNEDAYNNLQKLLLLKAQPVLQDLKCPQCHHAIVDAVEKFAKRIGEEIENIVSQVGLELHLKV